MRALAGRPVDEAPVLAPQRRPGPPLERARGQTLVDQRGRHDHVAVRERVPNRLRATLRVVTTLVPASGNSSTSPRSATSSLVTAGRGRSRSPPARPRPRPPHRLADDGHHRLAHEPHPAVGQQRAGHGGWVGGADLGSGPMSRSAAVTTSTTPGADRAASTSTDRMSACATGEVTYVTLRHPGRSRSATYRVSPVSRRRSSRRATGVPTSGIGPTLPASGKELRSSIRRRPTGWSGKAVDARRHSRRSGRGVLGPLRTALDRVLSYRYLGKSHATLDRAGGETMRLRHDMRNASVGSWRRRCASLPRSRGAWPTTVRAESGDRLAAILDDARDVRRSRCAAR